MNYPVQLGGVTFDVPSLPWRLVQKVQPGLLDWLFKFKAEANGDAVRLSSEELAKLTDLVFLVVAHSAQGKGYNRETFEELPLTALQMAASVAPILQACGLQFKSGAPAPEDGSNPKA